jgi:hypothetical protein
VKQSQPAPVCGDRLAQDVKAEPKLSDQIARSMGEPPLRPQALAEAYALRGHGLKHSTMNSCWEMADLRSR